MSEKVGANDFGFALFLWLSTQCKGWLEKVLQLGHIVDWIKVYVMQQMEII